MAMIPVNRVGDVGMISDQKPHELPLNAWSDVRNMRFRDGVAEKFLGESTFGTASIAPYFLLPVPSGATYFWMYAGLTKVYVFDGTTHTNITRQTAMVDVDYGATVALNWTGGLLNGVPVINNGSDVPQMWSPQTAVTKLVALTNWNAAWSCRALRPFRSFLVAMDVTKSGTHYGQMVKWSHPADTGGVPSSWDETDPTKDAGEYMLAETPGLVIDCAPMRDVNIVYKEDSIYQMQYIGGVFIFRFSAIAKTIGLISRRCAVEFLPGRHLAFGVGDIVQHDGQQVSSILDGRMRKWLFNNMNTEAMSTCFVANMPNQQEVWCCFPMNNSIPDTALVWNWKQNTCAIRQLNDCTHIANGVLSEGVLIWNTTTSTWEATTSAWDGQLYSAAELTPVQARPTASLLSVCEISNTFTGSVMQTKLERTGITLPINADEPPDFSTYKFMSSIWPRIEGTDGGQINVSVGVQQQIDGAVTWENPVIYTIGTTQKIDCRVAGRLLAVKFESNTDIDWRLHGYEMNIQPGGRF